MLETTAKKNNFYQLVVDQETFGILATCSSLPVAHAIVSGIPNSSVMKVQLPGYEILNGNQYNIDLSFNLTLVRKNQGMLIPSDGNVAKRVEETKSGNLFDVEEYLNPPGSWMVKRKLASLRRRAIWLVEQKIERFLARTKTFIGDEIFIPFMIKELENTESVAIKEWAEIRGISEDEARTDLTIKIKSIQLSVCRLHAIWEKYISWINQTEVESEMMAFATLMLENELRSGIR